MKQNKFIIITPCHNVADWLAINLNTTKYQSYKNFLCLVINDKSTDRYIHELSYFCGDNWDERFKFISTPEGRGGSQGDAYLYGMEFLEYEKLINDDDIIVEIDGDDWLSSVFVLDYLNNIYQDSEVWMTYGQYQMYPSGQLGGHFDMHIAPLIDKFNNYRKSAFPYSHLKTYKYWLFNKIDRKDLIDKETGKIYNAAWDHALCLPMVEMAGSNHIHRCDDILYILNRSEELQNEGKVNTNNQKLVEQRIRQNQPVYNRL